MSDSYLEFAKKLAREAGEIMRKYFDKNPESEYKGDKTLVTIADKEINDLVIQRVHENFPHHAVNGVEKSTKNSSNKTWVCDPIDGTNMFARSVPVSTFSLAFCIDGEPQLGVIYDPSMDKLYSAAKNQGAFCNDQPIHVNKLGLDDLGAMINFDHFYDCSGNRGSVANVLPAMNEITKRTYSISIGSCVRGMSMLAGGKLVAAIFPGGEGKEVDVAAAKILIEEAGGKTSDLRGGARKYDRAGFGFLGSNGIVHDEILDYIEKYAEEN